MECFGSQPCTLIWLFFLVANSIPERCRTDDLMPSIPVLYLLPSRVDPKVLGLNVLICHSDLTTCYKSPTYVRRRPFRLSQADDLWPIRRLHFSSCVSYRQQQLYHWSRIRIHSRRTIYLLFLWRRGAWCGVAALSADDTVWKGQLKTPEWALCTWHIKVWWVERIKDGIVHARRTSPWKYKETFRTMRAACFSFSF